MIVLLYGISFYSTRSNLVLNHECLNVGLTVSNSNPIESLLSFADELKDEEERYVYLCLAFSRSYRKLRPTTQNATLMQPSTGYLTTTSSNSQTLHQSDLESAPPKPPSRNTVFDYIGSISKPLVSVLKTPTSIPTRARSGCGTCYHSLLIKYWVYDSLVFSEGLGTPMNTNIHYYSLSLSHVLSCLQLTKCMRVLFDPYNSSDLE